MWDRPALLERAAHVLFALAALLVAGALLLHVSRRPEFALREVRIAAPLMHVSRDDIEATVGRDLRGTFFTLDLDRARAAFERLPWVRSVAVSRRWPAALDVTIEEHQPFARWVAPVPRGQAAPPALVNTHGEVFQAAYDAPLPVFAGPEGSAREIAIQYRYFRRGLAAIGETPVEVRVSARRAWQLKLESGLTLALGREDVETRLARFVAAYGQTLARLNRRVDYVDLRYANGFAVRVPGLTHETTPPRRARRTG
jgi:cell division protein FtsQ